MCAEMNQGICLEFVLNPKVGSYISMWGSDACAVDDLELIVAFCCMRLWEEYDISELQAGDSQRGLSVMPGAQVIARCFSVLIYHFLIFIGDKRLCSPLLIGGLADPERVAILHKLILCPFGIGS